MNDFTSWYKSQPFFTRTMFTGLVATTVLGSFEIFSPMYLALIPDNLLKLQIWRLISNFFFMGLFSPNIIWTIFFLHFSFSRLESLFRPQQLADLLWLVLFNMLVLDIIGLILGYNFLLQSLMISFIYIWSKKKPFEEVYFLFGLKVKSAYFCFVLIGFHLITGKQIFQDLFGVAVGHLYIILKDILPSKNYKDYLQTPEFLQIKYNQFIYLLNNLNNSKRIVFKYILGNTKIIGGVFGNVEQQQQQQQQNQWRQFAGRHVRIGGEERRNQ
ncbi:hypothetical protein IMG5_098270 [Ichthyophthirius multifiliis]|uniref:Derlin n=1 Tax=Ichthyophthirius multifiliis TaxID=5932 RepID=G0QRX1_ICHMU|nr:hypothetical protein IMG5_098270 [Ichthyophthirius multifiliis]EGR32001.1 hypothetical protein IMG5_098270 [Ichthyophthirius multifiliis]|eukprot:XP_004035487.1 hypothetical protein IMG5_098270 [Ichthyophthirius multifiliis]